MYIIMFAFCVVHVLGIGSYLSVGSVNSSDPFV